MKIKILNYKSLKYRLIREKNSRKFIKETKIQNKTITIILYVKNPQNKKVQTYRSNKENSKRELLKELCLNQKKIEMQYLLNGTKNKTK